MSAQCCYYLVDTGELNCANKSSTEGTVEEVCRGIQLYFDRSLGNLLLYRFERQQYVDVKKESKDKEMSEIYGAEHLLRLFGRLPAGCSHCIS